MFGLVVWRGYAALQSNVLDPSLFKAVVAVAPVTDLALLRHQGNGFTNANLVDQFIGTGAHIEEGSPANNAKVFAAPVLMFHGDTDFNVSIDQSRKMDRELREAGKSSELVVYPGLDHGLVDGTARADMLRRIGGLPCGARWGCKYRVPAGFEESALKDFWGSPTSLSIGSPLTSA